MFSLSHLAVVAVVVAVMVAAWKFDRKGPRGRSFRPQKAPPKSVQRQLLKLAVLIVLTAGALAPALGFDEASGYVHSVHIVCTLGLAGFAYMWLFPSGEE